MAFSINTNITSLQAQYYLNKTQQFQAKTINEVTSGLRIVNSGDDAAGLAVANQYRSDQAVLTQGIQNLNSATSTLQTVDGAMSNIGNLLDRARTLATQSSSTTFTGDRTALNSEFQSVMTEINRQAQAAGVDVGGTFAKSLQVFVGGGTAGNGQTAIQNGAVTADLTKATVDTQSLGLTGYGYQTSVADFAAGHIPSTGTATLNFAGAGFSGSSAVNVTVNLTGVADVNSLVSAINTGIQSAGQGGTPASSAFASANIVASADSSGHINFTSSTNAFKVADGGTAGNADNTNARFILADSSAAAITNGYAEGTDRQNTMSLAISTDATATQKINFSSDNNGTVQSIDVTLAAGSLTSQNSMLDAINSQLQNSNDASLQKIVAVAEDATHIGFTSTQAFNMKADISGVTAGKGLTSVGTLVQATTVTGETGTNVAIDSISGAQAAVSALAGAVTSLGQAQAIVGKGENVLNYATSLASTQLTNMASSESQIRDADLAAQAANLSKAQILSQAGVAALAQANSAPQAILSLLKG